MFNTFTLFTLFVFIGSFVFFGFWLLLASNIEKDDRIKELEEANEILRYSNRSMNDRLNLMEKL